MQSNLAAPGLAGEKVDLGEIGRKLWRGKRLIVLTILVGCGLGYLILKQLTPVYQAASTVMLETRPRQIVETQDVVPRMLMDTEGIEGEIEVLYSRALAEKVVAKLNLYLNPEFNSALRNDGAESSWTTLLGYVPSGLAAAVRDPWTAVAGYLPSGVAGYASEFLDGVAADGEALTDQQVAARLKKRVIDTFLGQLNADQVGQSPVIRISFQSDSPQTAALIANTVAETYIDSQLESKLDATRQASTSLRERIAQLRVEVEEKERAIEQVRTRGGLLQGKDVTVATQQLQELASQLVTAQVERQATESRLQQVETAPDSAPEVLGSNLVGDLRVKEAELGRQLAELRVEYGPRHPQIVNGEANLRDIQSSIRLEINKIVAGLRNQVEASRRREAAIKEALDQASSRVGPEEVQLRALERDAEASRTLLESLLARAEETDVQEGFQQPDAKVISLAEMPEKPAFPNERLIMLLAFCGSAFAGVSLAYALQAMDQSFHTAAQVQEALNLQVLELVPQVRRLSRKASPVDFIAQRPTSGFGEALRSLQVTLFAGRHPPKTILFTSSLPGEGKTAMTLSFGRFLAMADRATVVVDCDLRKPSVHGTLRGHAAPGLVDHLLGDATLDEVIQVDDVTGLHYIAAGPPASNPTDLFTSGTMHATMAELSKRYDVVLLDSAPVLAVADTRCLNRLVDHTLFVIRWCATQRSTAREAVRRLHDEASLNTASAILNLVDTKVYRQYDFGYYYDAVKGYYGE